MMRPGGVGTSPMSDMAVTDLPEPDSPDNAKAFALLEVQVDAAHRAIDVIADVKLRVQVRHFQNAVIMGAGFRHRATLNGGAGATGRVSATRFQPRGRARHARHRPAD